MNLMTAIFSAATVAVVYRILLLLTGRVILSLAISLFFAFSYYFWTVSVVAEVYTLHALLTGLVLLMLLLWERGGERRHLYVAAAIWGLSFGNHMSTVLLGPAFGYLLLVGVHRRAFAWRDILPVAGLFSIGLLTYAYLPLRYLAGAGVHVGHFDGVGEFTRINLASIGGMWAMLSGKEFGVFLFPYDFFGAMKELGRYLSWLSGNFLGVGVLLGLGGMVYQASRHRHQFILLFLAFMANVIFFVNYGALVLSQPNCWQDRDGEA